MRDNFSTHSAMHCHTTALSDTNDISLPVVETFQNFLAAIHQQMLLFLLLDAAAATPTSSVQASIAMHQSVHDHTRLICLFRWAMTGTDASKSPTQLRIELLEEDSKHCLACISGPGFQRKKFWVQQPEPDVICAMDTDDRTWLQVIVATAMIAAKTQRHRDKVTSAARRIT